MPIRKFKLALYFFLALLVTFFTYSSFPRNSLSVSDQPRGASVKVAAVSLAKDGFVFVFDQSVGDPLDSGEFLGVSEYLPAGKYRDLNILFEDEEKARSLNGATLIVIEDNGNGFFETQDVSGGDTFAKTIGGKLVRKTIKFY